MNTNPEFSESEASKKSHPQSKQSMTSIPQTSEKNKQEKPAMLRTIPVPRSVKEYERLSQEWDYVQTQVRSGKQPSLRRLGTALSEAKQLKIFPLSINHLINTGQQTQLSPQAIAMRKTLEQMVVNQVKAFVEGLPHAPSLTSEELEDALIWLSERKHPLCIRMMEQACKNEDPNRKLSRPELLKRKLLLNLKSEQSESLKHPPKTPGSFDKVAMADNKVLFIPTLHSDHAGAEVAIELMARNVHLHNYQIRILSIPLYKPVISTVVR